MSPTIRLISGRVWQAAIVLFFSLTIVFVIGSILGDPAELILGVDATQAQVDHFRETLGFEASPWQRYVKYLVGATQGDFGPSFWQNRPAMEIVLERLPATLYLAGLTLLVAFPTGLSLGALAAFRPDSLIDRFLSVLSMVSISIVEFWFGLMLVLIIGVHVGWIPTGGYGTVAHAVLPVMTLSLQTTGRVAQMTRSSLLQELSKPYVTLAKAKGLSPLSIHAHALRNALLPIITLSGDSAYNLVNAAVVVEAIFAWPGVGRLLLQAIINRDLFVLQAAVLVITVLAVLINLLVDLSYLALNPRVREAATV